MRLDTKRASSDDRFLAKRRQKEVEAMRQSEMGRLLTIAKGGDNGLEQVARELDRTCPYCEGLLIPRIVPFSTPWGERDQLIFPDKCGCKGEQEAIKNGEHSNFGWAGLSKVDERKRKEELHRIKFERAGLTGWLKDVTFDSFLPRQEWPKAIQCKQVVVDYCEAMLAGALDRPFLILCGEYGTGKTLLAASVIRAAIDAGWRHAYFRSWVEFTDRIKATWEKDAQEQTSQVLDELGFGRVVVIDDIDKKKATDWTRERLYPVIDKRWRDALPTILTFNLMLTEKDTKAVGRYALEEFLGIGVMDRVIQAAYSVVEFTGPSYRSGITWKKNGEEELFHWQEQKDCGIGA